jgi:hypothetical protein
MSKRDDATEVRLRLVRNAEGALAVDAVSVEPIVHTREALVAVGKWLVLQLRNAGEANLRTQVHSLIDDGLSRILGGRR